MSKVYTRTGDGGTTSLIGAERVSKADPRVEAYGTVDELSAHLALLGDMMRGNADLEETVAALERIQVELMTVEALLATGRGGEGKVAGLSADAVGRLEGEIDAMSAGLPPVGGFTLPGGHPVVSQCHVCRTVCRRAERAAVGIADAMRAPSTPCAASAGTATDDLPTPSDAASSGAVYPVSPTSAAVGVNSAAGYLNRLSDWLYTLGRRAAAALGVKEIYWIP